MLNLSKDSDDLLYTVSLLHGFYGCYTAELSLKSVQFYGPGSKAKGVELLTIFQSQPLFQINPFSLQSKLLAAFAAYGRNQPICAAPK
jgi:hypothetical protein